ncbi:Methylated-DNA--protein-cysteine methyltransferase [Roseibacterium elongatum DSM 19469]|uniref:Methylated-DNA--protein-cysteine methyltransferase n=1 Tax=Roseicyclus elongatus DSM 19469 TaxID=1294273 RepID=W8RSM6_9RHOB|nr:Methylated-DNA--protein-cysteine methyltransferase [Roseibacterium elongatum DSM 19469]
MDTPLGSVWVEVADRAVVASGWGAAQGGDDPVLRTALDEVVAYFDRRLDRFTVPIRPQASGLSGRVLDALSAIPFGETRTYGDLSKDLGAPAQAIGRACGSNPVPILIPCHRVLGATSLGGFSAPGGIEAKVWLLGHEGAAGLLI